MLENQGIDSMKSLDFTRLSDFIDKKWNESVLPSLCEFIEIPALSPSFDSDWEENGYLDAAIETFISWVKSLPLERASVSVHRLRGRSPVLLVTIDGDAEGEILFYSHLDKQPEATGWSEGKGPWKPVIEDNWLYGRGSVDDGYGGYAGVLSVLGLQEQGLSHPTCRFLIETGEESGSPDLELYLDELKPQLGIPDLVIVLDTGGMDYDRLWVTQSLRGIVAGTLSVKVSSVGVHSGHGSGVMPSSFRLARQLLSRIEDENTGEILLDELHTKIPDHRVKETEKLVSILGEEVVLEFPWKNGMKPSTNDKVEGVLRRTWRPALSIVGSDGLPPTANAGNVLRPYTTLQLSMRIPPMVDAKKAKDAIKEKLTTSIPYDAEITLHFEEAADGWNAPETSPWLIKAIEKASENYFDEKPCSISEGGTIPFMAMLGERFPNAQFVITGVLGPQSNAHGPNEFLHIPFAKKLTCCISSIISDFK